MKKILYSLIVIMVVIFIVCEDLGLVLFYVEEYFELDVVIIVIGFRIYNYFCVNDGVGLFSGFVVNFGVV